MGELQVQSLRKSDPTIPKLLYWTLEKVTAQRWYRDQGDEGKLGTTELSILLY